MFLKAAADEKIVKAFFESAGSKMVLALFHEVKRSFEAPILEVFSRETKSHSSETAPPFEAYIIGAL